MSGSQHEDVCGSAAINPSVEGRSPDFSRLRIDYKQRTLSEADVDADPILQFVRWLNEAIAAGANEPNAMTLASVSADGSPSARIVLLKRVDARGFAFFTNYLSRKGRELDADPRAALAFFWPELERQVRVEGRIERTSEAESDEYFNQRPLKSRIGAAASPQSETIASREILESLERAVAQRYPNGEVPRPRHWGGYCLRPTKVEFWQGRSSRLHDRIEYFLDDAGQWRRRRSAP
ncbi:MAG TPA: pyridoxamine 5'-phosphate oxidase [Tepidisphaeraceae bacterium]|nr:pyridoxamine 5'-phosphate oxidase [Tepidisphaeraceae bacterium]